MSYITAKRLGRVLIWAWNKYVKKTAIPYKEIDFHYSDWVFLLTGLVFLELRCVSSCFILHSGEHNSSNIYE